MNVKDEYIERRGQYINILTKSRKYHKLDFLRREEYEGQPIEVIHGLIAKLKEHIQDTKNDRKIT